MEKADMDHRDSSSGHSPCEDEKKIGVEPGAFEKKATSELPPDPDEGLSEEERARIVSHSLISSHTYSSHVLMFYHRTADFF